MTQKKKASDMLSRMKSVTTRETPVSTALEDIVPVASAAPEPVGSKPPKPRRIRYTLDLVPEQHKALKRFAVEAEVDASEVMRALLTLLQEKPEVRNAVLTVISKD